MARTSARTKGTTSGETVIYCRISLDATGEEKGGERQEAECRALAQRNGWAVARVYVDNDLSATTGKARPAFEELLSSNPERIVVWHVDRLLRLTADLERVIALGVNIHAVSSGWLDLSNPAGRAVARTVTAWATYEGEQKGERMRAQQRQRAESGQAWWSQRPFGYEEDGTLREEEASLIRAAYGSLNRGGTYAAITRQWREAGVTTAKGKEWSPTTVRQMLLAPRNAGMLESHGEVVGKGQWEAILPYDEWRAIVHRAGNSEMKGRGQGHRKGLLSGLAACGVCGERVQWRSRRAAARGTVRKVYGGKCGHATAPVEWLDEHVSKAVLRRLSSPAAILSRGAVSGKDAAAQTALARVEEIRRELDETTQDFLAGHITRQQRNDISAALRAELEGLEALAERAYHPTEWGHGSPREILAGWAEMDPNARRAVIASVYDVQILPKRQGETMKPTHVRLTRRGN